MNPFYLVLDQHGLSGKMEKRRADERWRMHAWVRWKLGTEPGSSEGECPSDYLRTQGRAEAIEAIALGLSL